MLAVYTWCIGCRALHAEVVPDLTGVDGRLGLGDQFRSAHILAIPVCGAIQSKLGALLAARICRVLVRGG